MLVSVLRYYPTYDIEDVKNLTLADYEVLMSATRLKGVDDMFNIHLQAWKNQEVQATKKVGRNTKPYYTDFQSFFDYKKYEEEQINIIKDKDATQELIKKKKVDTNLLGMITNANKNKKGG